MQSLIDFVARFKELITFTALVIICLSLISIGNVSQIGGFRAILIGTVGNLQQLFSWIPNPQALRNENRALRELNLQLSTEVIRMREASVENNRLRKMIEFRQMATHPMIPAQVIGKSVVEMRNFMTINRGRGDSIAVGMPVRTDAGLVGIVVGVSAKYSIVELITNRNVKISSRILRTGIAGIAVWDGGENFMLNNIPESFDVVKGDYVVTSDFSNKYPTDIPFGEIIKVVEDPSSLFKKIYIQPFANINSLEQVFVVKFLPDPERMELIEQIEEQLRLRK
ncbi:MAG: rod shape-determining protein MreC [Ignavibacteriae bacterium HGW-Ignavibacteriae-1]|jgi:rod shape-determining protein MreC|nr:MAG: rod shape-determining protein MreC [Ignavibacteriae bacterium HGW-Ignavibacteriae-1]